MAWMIFSAVLPLGQSVPVEFGDGDCQDRLDEGCVEDIEQFQ